MKTPADKWQRRPYQREVIRALAKRRFFVLLWRRQGGKSTVLAEASLYGMMRQSGLTVTYASASLLLGREIIYKESQVMARAIRMLGQEAAAAEMSLEAVDRDTGKGIGMSPDDWAELFESQRLEFRLHHDRTTYSRTQVIAPNPATARGWTGWVFLDEFGFIRDFADLWEAVEPIVSTDRTFHLVMATTPPKDDSHYSYELTSPGIDRSWPVSADGNWYVSEAGVDVHRVDIHDAYAAGVRLYDLRTGAELTPAEHFARADDKDAWRRNYKVEHVLGGTSAVGLLALNTAQERGVGECRCVVVDKDEDFEEALEWLEEHIDPRAKVGLGWDLATTEKESSNPSAMAVVEEHGVEQVVRLVLVWKTKDPEVARARARAVVEQVASRGEEGRVPARRLAIDATNERYFASDMRRALMGEVPVSLVVGSEAVERAGIEPMNWKQYLGSQLVSAIEDNRMTLPPEKYLKEDFRLVKKDRGAFVCVPDAEGRHGDTFDAVKLGLQALGSGDGALCSTEGIFMGGTRGLPVFRPARYRMR